MNTTRSTIKHTVRKDLVEQARQLRLQAEELEKQARFARGTSDVTAEVALIGDEMPTGALLALVQTLITDKPLTFQELLEATGARDNRVKGVLMRLQREGVKVVNLGSQTKARWFIPDEAVLRRITRSRRNTQRHG